MRLSDPDEQDAWLDLLEAEVLVVDDDPDVLLTDHPEEDDDVPVVSVRPDEPASVAGVVPPDAEVEVVVAALWAARHGLQVRPRAEAVDVPSLTRREQQVLELLAFGLSNREIGDALSISPHTAKFHVQGLLEKLDATTRTEAAVRAARWLLI